MVKHFKHLRFKPKNKESFSDLKNEKFFSNIFNKKVYQYILAETLIKVIRDLNHSDRNAINITFITRYFERHLRRVRNVEYYENIDIPDHIKTEILNELCYIFQNENVLSDFKGKILEYYILYIEKYRYSKWRKTLTQHKIYYECYPRYKRKDYLFSTHFDGDGCDVDIIKVEKYGEYINLIECKFNLEGNIIRYNSGNNNDLQKKLNYMDNLEFEISNYNNFYGEKVEVKKSLASFSDITTHLPSRFTSYNIMNVLEELEKIVELQYS